MLPAWEDVPSSGFRCPRRDCRPAEDGWSSRILIEKPVSVGTRVQLLCPTCRAQLFPCDCCAALVCKDESSSQGALGQRATCRLCGTCTVLGDSERLILGLEPILALSPEDALRIQVKAVGKHAYKKHKVAELLDLREKLRCLAAAVEGPQLQEPGSSSQDCRGSISSTERAAKRQRTAGDATTKVTVHRFDDSVGVTDVQDESLGTVCGREQKMQDMKASMARCRWQILLLNEASAFEAGDNRHPDFHPFQINLLRELQHCIQSNNCWAHIMRNTQYSDGSSKLLDETARFLEARPEVEAKQSRARVAWRLVQQAEQDCRNYASRKPNQTEFTSRVLLGILKEQQRFLDGEAASAAGWVMVRRDAVKAQQDTMSTALLELCSSPHEGSQQVDKESASVLSQHGNQHAQLKASLLEALKLWRQLYKCLSSCATLPLAQPVSQLASREG